MSKSEACSYGVICADLYSIKSIAHLETKIHAFVEVRKMRSNVYCIDTKIKVEGDLQGTV